MDRVKLENWIGIMSIIAAIGILIGLKTSATGRKPMLAAGIVFVVLATITAATFSTLEALATSLHALHRLSDGALEETIRINTLWVLVYPALVGALGINLLTAWFQSAEPASEATLIKATVSAFLIEQQRKSDHDSEARAEQATGVRPSKKVRGGLARRR